LRVATSSRSAQPVSHRDEAERCERQPCHDRHGQICGDGVAQQYAPDAEAHTSEYERKRPHVIHRYRRRTTGLDERHPANRSAYR